MNIDEINEKIRKKEISKYETKDYEALPEKVKRQLFDTMYLSNYANYEPREDKPSIKKVGIRHIWCKDCGIYLSTLSTRHRVHFTSAKHIYNSWITDIIEMKNSKQQKVFEVVEDWDGPVIKTMVFEKNLT